MAGVGSLILGGVSALIALKGASMSFRAAAEQRQDAAEAKRKSEQMMKEAKKRMEANFHEGLNIPLDAYSRQREMSILSSQTGIQALQEGDSRALAAGIGALGQVASSNDEKMRVALGKELYDNRVMKADAKSAMNDEYIKMGLGQSTQYNQEAQDLKEGANQAVVSGFSALGDAVGAGSDMLSLYGKGKTGRQITDLSEGLAAKNSDYSAADIQKILNNTMSRNQIDSITNNPELWDVDLSQQVPYYLKTQ